MNLLNGAFIRGLGVGLIVAGLLWNFSMPSSVESQSKTQTPVQSSGATQPQGSGRQNNPSPAQQKESPATKTTALPTQSTSLKPTQQSTTPTLEQSAQQTNQQTNQQTAEPSELMSLKIPPGSGSEEIAALLHKKGLIDSEEDFAAVSKKMKADTRFRAGTFTIPKGSSEREIIAILTGK
ncbi:MAG TPA: hypothetical protein VHS59_13030 [Bacillota bacterium]|nr:hypothetical protein [Bacillota bacterium]